jgi:membrane protein implicated in regulation of membrane protease activity
LTKAHANTGARAPEPSPINWVNVVTWTSVGILVGTEVLGATLAAAWAAGGLMELGPALQYALYAIALVLAVAVMVPFMKRAALVESLRGPQHDGEQP